MKKFIFRKEYLLIGISFILLIYINVFVALNHEVFSSGESTGMALPLFVSNILFIILLISSFIVLLLRLSQGRRDHRLSQIMLDTIPMACSIRDENNRILDCNREALRMFGLSKKSEFIDHFERLNPEFQNDGKSSREKALEYIRAVFETGYQRFEWTYRTTSGEVLPVETILVKVTWDTVSNDSALKDTGMRFACYSRDLREIKANQKEIGEAEERTRIMLDSTPLACSFWDDDGTLLDCNSEALRIFGLSEKSEYANSIAKLSPPFQSDGMPSMEKMEQMDRIAFEKGFNQFHWMHCTLSGEPLPVETTLVRIPWKGHIALATYSRDLREEKANEERVREADAMNREMEVQTRAAQAASEAKSRFLASMSHEIRTPMNAIIGMSDLMRTDNLDNIQKGYFEDIKKMSHALLQIINDILDFSRIEAGKLELIPVHFNLFELYDHISSMSRFTANAKELEFTSSFDPSLPHVIYGDDVRIRQVIVNIVNNAIKYTREGSVDLKISRIVENNTGYTAVIVKDTGIGIREEDVPKLFGVFQQMDKATNRGIVGTGLGLSITKKLVDMMHGEIRLKSVYGEGSEFTVLLPLREGDPSLIEKEDISSFAVAGTDAHVLVVDDNQINLKVAIAYLARHNITADTASNGFEAIDMVKQKNYDLVFMDHMMPELDGVEAARRIRSLAEEVPAGTGEAPLARLKTMPIIALSANAVTGAREIFLEARMNDFISKPIEPKVLNRILLKYLPPGKVSEQRISGNGKPTAGGVSASSAAGLSAAVGSNPVVLDRVAGLKNAVGDQKFYDQLVTIFKNQHGADLEKIEAAMKTGDRVLVRRISHTLKSSAALIGSEPLRQASLAVENGITNGEDFSPERVTFLGKVLTAVLDELGDDSAYRTSRPEHGNIVGLDGNAAASNNNTTCSDSNTGISDSNVASSGSNAAGLDNEAAVSDACSLINTLFPLLETGNTDCFNYIEAIRQKLLPLNGEAAFLIREIENFEFEKASVILTAIKELLE